MGKIVALVGPSGAGKTTAARELRIRLLGAKLISSYTTRLSRPSDLPGEYRFVLREKFNKMQRAGEFLWSVEHGGECYGTTWNSILNVLDDDITTGIMILVPDVVPRLQDFVFRERGDHTAFRPVFILPPSKDTLVARMLARGESELKIEGRLELEKDWVAEAKKSEVIYWFVDSKDTIDRMMEDILTLLK